MKLLIDKHGPLFVAACENNSLEVAKKSFEVLHRMSGGSTDTNEITIAEGYMAEGLSIALMNRNYLIVETSAVLCDRDDLKVLIERQNRTIDFILNSYKQFKQTRPNYRLNTTDIEVKKYVDAIDFWLRAVDGIRPRVHRSDFEVMDWGGSSNRSHIREHDIEIKQRHASELLMRFDLFKC